MSRNEVPWGKLLGDSVEFEEQVRCGDIVLDDDDDGRRGGAAVAVRGASSRLLLGGSRGRGRIANPTDFLPEYPARGLCLPKTVTKARKPQGRGRGAPLPTPVDDDGDEVFGSRNSEPEVLSPTTKRMDDLRNQFLASGFQDNRKGPEKIAVTLSEFPKKQVVTLCSPNVSPKRGIIKEPGISPSYVPHGRGTVINRSGIDSPGLKYAQQYEPKTEQNEPKAQQNEAKAQQNKTKAQQYKAKPQQNEAKAQQNEAKEHKNEAKAQQNEAKIESSPTANVGIHNACLKSRTIVLKKLLLEEEKGYDSDDSESVDNFLDNKLMQSEPTEPGLLTKDGDSKAEKDTELSELTVEYGCIQLADVPGRILVRGGEKHRPLRKIELLDNYDILKRGINNCGIQDLNMLQKAVAPYVFSGADCFIFGGKSCGKSLSYLIPMIGNFITEFEIQGSSSMENESGPIALIICKDFHSGLKLEGYINNLVTSANKYQIFGALVCDDRRETREKLEIGVDIMITTLDFATLLAKRKYNTLPLKSVRMLVFEEIDVLLRMSPYDFQLINQAAENFAAKQQSNKPFQRVFCGKDWTSEVEDLYMSLYPLPDPSVGQVPVILIQSPNQAIKYAKLKLHFHHVPSEPYGLQMKLYKLKDLLESKDLEHHLDIFVACSLPNVVLFVHEGLKRLKIDSQCAETMTMEHHELGAIKRSWQDSPTKRRILILHDKVLRSLEVHNVTLLIHFDLPVKTPEVITATGADRFSCMWGNFRDLSKEKRKPLLVDERKDLESHFFLTGKEPELHKLKVFGLKLNCVMPESLDKIADEMGKAHMDKKKVCPYIKLYGECYVSSSEVCPFRHYFLAEELEKKPSVPRNCELELRITRCVNPSQYIGQIIRLHEIEKGKRKPAVSYANLLNKRTSELTAYYETEDNRLPLECYAPGSLCGVELPEGEGYARAVIERVMTRTSLNLPNTIRVYCLDTGEHLQPQAEDLLVLPEDMKDLKNLAIEINLCNLQPMRGEVDYRHQHIHGAKKLTEDKILIGRVRFAVGSEVWINPLIEMEVDPVSKCATKKLSIRLELIRLFYAENNETHLSKIFKLCKDTGFHCPELDDDFELEARLPSFFQLGDDINWAYLVVNDSEIDMSSFWPTYTKDPYNIFGVQDKFTEQLDNLENDVHNYGVQMISELCQNYAIKFATMYAPDVMVVAYDSLDKMWRRALIVAAYEKDDQSFFDVYFTDVGQLSTDFTTKDLLPIPTHLVNRLPCQAIALRLSHIRPKDSEKTNVRWSSDVTNKLLTYTINEEDDSIQMDVVARKSIVHPNYHCRYYEAVILQPNGDDIGESLVADNLAEFVEGEEGTAKSIRTRILAKINQSFNVNVDEDDDENSEEADDDGNLMLGDGVIDDDEDRWDIAGFDLGKVREMCGLGSNEIKKSEAIEDDNSSYVIEAESTDGPVETATQSGAKPSFVVQSDQPASSASLTKPPLFSDLLHPTVFWKQTKLELTLNIQLPDIKDYELNVSKQTVSFRTLKPAGYGFDLEFRGRIHRPEVEVFGLYMKIKLKKRVEWLWPKLLKDPNQKFSWLKQDFDADDSDDEEWPTVEDANKDDKKEDNDGNEKKKKKPALLPYEWSSDSNSDEDVDDVELAAGEELTEAEISQMMTQVKLGDD